MEAPFWPSFELWILKAEVITYHSVHSFSGLFAFFSALTKLQHLATRICSHSRNAITRTLRGILHGVRLYLDLPGPRGTVFLKFLSQTISDVETKQNAKQFCLVQLEKRYRVLGDLCNPQKPSKKSLEEITQLLLEHLKPKHLVVAESFKFYNAKQEEGESISNFLVRLKHLASPCEFGSFLKRALRDKFVCGLKDDGIQEKLLSEDEEAVKMAKAMELATANAAYIKEKETDEVNKMCAEFELQKLKKMCLGCDGKWHERRSQCPAWGKTCLKCNNKNHFSRHCKNEQRGNMLHYIQVTHDILLLSTRYSNNKPYTCKLELNGVHCEMKIDTGCSSTLISKKQFDLLSYARLSKKRTILRLRTYSGEVIILNKFANLKVKYLGKMYDLRVLVVPGSEPSLFGRDWLEKLQFNISATWN